jgi:hypothetical protein
MVTTVLIVWLALQFPLAVVVGKLLKTADL